MEREKTCCFSGHRPDQLPWNNDEQDPRCLEFKNRLRQAAEEAYASGIRHYMCGMALGSDIYFCEMLMELRQQLPSITIEAVLPCEEQAAHWRDRERERYFHLVERCDYETMVQRHYDRGCMLRRNRYMVDRSALLIAAYSGMLGDTMYTMSYARKKGVKTAIVDLEPMDFLQEGV